MVREDGKRTRAEIFGDSILPGLGSQEGWHMDQEKRQTKALEKIAKGYKDRRIVQEVARRESSVPDKQVYNLPSAYVPDEVVRGFENLRDSQDGTTWAVEDNTVAVRQSAEVIYGGLMNVESRVGDVVDAAYSIDGHVQGGNDLLRHGNRLASNINSSVRRVSSDIQDQTETLGKALSGVSPQQKNVLELGSLLNGEEEMVAMALKGILDSRESWKLLNSFDVRKQELIEQVIDFDPHFDDPIYDEIKELEKKRRRNLGNKKTQEKITAEINQKRKQLEEEKKYLQNLKFHLQSPLQTDSLRILARHGHLDRFVQDEFGENIREVRTDTYGLNQSAREALSMMDTSLKNQEAALWNQGVQIANQDEMISLQGDIKQGIILQNQKQDETNSALRGISPQRKNISKIISSMPGEEEEMVSMALRGILDKKEKGNLFRNLGGRKQMLMNQAANFDSKFHDPILREIEGLEEKERDEEDYDKKEEFRKKIGEKRAQIKMENEYIEKVTHYAQEPLDAATLGALARHGYLDRDIQDELGKNVREVRTDVYGVNQGVSEMLSIMDEQALSMERQEINQERGLEKLDTQIENQGKGLINQGIIIELGKAQIYHQIESNELQRGIAKNADTQTLLQYGMLKELGIVGDKIEKGLNVIQETLEKTLELTAWTSVRVLATLEGIDISIKDQTKNWAHHRFEEQLNQSISLILEGEFDIALTAIKRAQKEDVSDPRGYFLKGISYLYTDDTKRAEKELQTAERTSRTILYNGATQEEVDGIVSQVNTYLGRLYFKLSQKNGADFEGKMKQAIESADEAYKRDKNISTGIDLARYLVLNGELDESYSIIKMVFRSFPEVVDVLLTDEDFAPFVAQVEKDKWKKLHDFRLQMLKKRKK